MPNQRILTTLLRPRAFLRALILAAVAGGVIGAGSANADSNLTVMTQNLYQGTEFAHFAALQGTTPTLGQALEATTADYATYQATRFKDRAVQLAGEIASNKPALVGLQEVATWHKGAFNPQHPFALPTPVSEDFTQELLAALAAKGAHYKVVSEHPNNFTLAFPVLVPPTFACCIAVGMVESGEIIARTDLPSDQFSVSNPQSGTYNARIPPIENTLVPSEPFVFTNSWQSVDVTVPGNTFRFITTHLDALDPSGFVRGIQAKELVAGPANTSLPVVVTGDMNSGPNSLPAAYDALLAGGPAGPLSDTWTAAGLGAPPLTCCHLEFNDLVNDPKAVYTQELDHVLTRGSLRAKSAHLVGNTVPEPAPEPFIWPSDHAGLVTTLATGP
jgi:endonuclease/exonuclease/phosphatase family metal-dependent hydrolase